MIVEWTMDVGVDEQGSMIIHPDTKECIFQGTNNQYIISRY